MESFEEQIRLREIRVPEAAEGFFARPLFRAPSFVITTLLGMTGLAIDIRLDIAAWDGTKLGYESLLWAVGCMIVFAWFVVTSHLEDVRAVCLNESGFPGQPRSVLFIALMSDFRTALAGLAVLYMTVIPLILVIWRLLLETAR